MWPRQLGNRTPDHIAADDQEDRGDVTWVG